MSSLDLSTKVRRILVFSALIVLVVFVGTIPLPQSLNCICKIEPVDIWYLKQDGAGQISTGWQRNMLGAAEEKTLRQFDRPDVVEIRLSPGLREGFEICKGDTVAVVNSFNGMGQLRALQALHAKAVAELTALSAGDRLEDQEVTLQQVMLAETALNAYKPEYERAEKLFNQSTISQSEWQAAHGQHMLLEAELQFARAQHQASKVGARPEDITVARAEIERIGQLIQNEIDALNRLEIIYAPISGMVRLGEENGFMVLVERTDTMTVVIAIPEVAASKIAAQHPVEINLLADTAPFRSSFIEHIDFRGMNTTNGLGFALLDNPERNLHRGMDGFARIPLGEITIWEWIKIKFHDFMI